MGRLLLTPTFCTEELELDTLAMLATMLATMEDMVLDIMARVRLSLRLKLTPTFCTEDMLDTMDMPDAMDSPMVDMPTMDKLLPLIPKWTANHPCFLYQ